MTRMLVVVRTADDAAAAFAGGADRLVARKASTDEGADRSVLRGIAAAAGGCCPITLWCFEAVVDDAGGWLEVDAVDEAFVGLDDGQPNGAVSALAVLPLVQNGLESKVEAAAARGFTGVLFGEGVQPRRLLQVVTINTLDLLVRQARAHQLAIGFAGEMEPPDIPRLLALAPDFLVFDDLVREPGRPLGPISLERMRLVRALIPADAAAAAHARPEPIGHDRIFVRDWTVSIRVGAYSHETAPQRARFTVEAALASGADRVADMRDVVTYDLITDAIGRATAGHVDLVETIAEEVAASILGHPRVMSVDVTVEKLDLGPGSLGCRLVRGRLR